MVIANFCLLSHSYSRTSVVLNAVGCWTPGQESCVPQKYFLTIEKSVPMHIIHKNQNKDGNNRQKNLFVRDLTKKNLEGSGQLKTEVTKVNHMILLSINNPRYEYVSKLNQRRISSLRMSILYLAWQIIQYLSLYHACLNNSYH